MKMLYFCAGFQLEYEHENKREEGDVPVLEEGAGLKLEMGLGWAAR